MYSKTRRNVTIMTKNSKWNGSTHDSTRLDDISSIFTEIENKK